MTRDLSVYGVFFESSMAFTLGETIDFTILLRHVEPGQVVRLRCQGHVVRLEPGENTVGVAVAITGYQLGSPGCNEVEERCYGSQAHV